MQKFTKENITKLFFNRFEKKEVVFAVHIEGPFEVVIKSNISLTCQDGYLVLDKEGFPYPVMKSEFESKYIRVI